MPRHCLILLRRAEKIGRCRHKQTTSPYARPKFESLALQRPWATSSRRAFSNLMSECTNPFSCTWATPWHTSSCASQGVAHVHLNGFVHSDIKFEKVLLEEVAHGRCSAKLSEIGLAYGEPPPSSSSSSCYHDNQYPSVDVSELSDLLRRAGKIGRCTHKQKTSPYARPKSESLALQRPWATSSKSTF